MSYFCNKNKTLARFFKRKSRAQDQLRRRRPVRPRARRLPLSEKLIGRPRQGRSSGGQETGPVHLKSEDFAVRHIRPGSQCDNRPQLRYTLPQSG